MSQDPESLPSGESKNREVFDIFDRASSHQRDVTFSYLIGDGIVVRVGWVDNDKANPDLTLELRDEKFSKGVGLTVDQDVARYVRETTPTLSATEWLAADKATRKQAREAHRMEGFSMPTASLEPVARAVSSHDSYSEPEPSDSESMFESSLVVEPLPSTDIVFIRDLIDAFTMPLD